jgi:hypothetical protein
MSVALPSQLPLLPRREKGLMSVLYDGKHLPKARSKRGDPLIRILRRRNAHTMLFSLARKPSQVRLSAVT